MGRPEDFYDDLASQYHLLFDDWWQAALEHAEVVARLLTARGVAPAGSRLLDCTCGIGTQALPLAAHGYAVTATDISARAIERARAEAERRDIHLDVAVPTFVAWTRWLPARSMPRSPATTRCRTC
jgi:glycine/sarcosine N-methyltransferase